MVAKPELRVQPRVVEGPDQVIASFGEVSPAVVVSRDNYRRPQDRGRGSGANAVQAQRAPPELARDARGTSVQHNRVDAREAPGDLGYGADGRVVTGDVNGGQVLAAQDEPYDLAVDEAVGVTLRVFGSVHGGDGGHAQRPAVGPVQRVAGPGREADGRVAEASGSAAGG